MSLQLRQDSSSSEVEQALEELKILIRRLELEYQLYFNKARDIPPRQMRQKVDKLIRRYRNFTFRNYAHRFKFSTIAGKYVTIKEVWDKRMRMIEQGAETINTGMMGGRRMKEKTEKKERPKLRPGRDSDDFIVDDKGSVDDEVKRMYNSYKAALKKCGRNPGKVSFEGFKNTIVKQTESLKQKKGCDSVGYQIKIDDDNKVKIKAKVMNKEDKG